MPYNSIASAQPVYGNQGSCRGSGQSCPPLKYMYAGFSVLQTAVDIALIRSRTNRSDFPVPELSVQMMPKPEFQSDTSYIQIISSIYFILAYAPFIQYLTVNLVAEKEKKIKEGMKMMGLRDSAFWLSWAAVYTIFIVLVTCVVTAIAAAAEFFSNSNLFLFFLMLVEYGLSIIALGFLVTPFFNKAQTAGGLASLFTMLISLTYLGVSLTRTYSSTGVPTYSVPPAGRWALCLLSPVALALAMDQGIYLDLARGGMGFDTATDGDFPLYAPLIMLAFDTVLYFFLAVYFDNVYPGAYGPRHPPWFLFKKSYWIRKHAPDVYMTEGIVNGIETDDNSLQAGGSHLPDIEPVPQRIKNNAAIRLFGITKIFNLKSKKEEVTAVNGLSLDMYEGQITALLGHNGAGKTTLLNMLCGLTGPTVGTATILGLDVSDSVEMDQIRSMTGICPQHNILFDDLSCEEHLKLFAIIKGLPEHKVEQEVQKSLKDVFLSDQDATHAKDLSGGQKRKLSVAIALIGDPKVIILDEPTAGMDPFSRRHLWATLKENKAGRVILLTTHFMDEADILADRKAIISKGKLRCCGSSLFLKNRFGLGYHLNMVTEPESDQEQINKLVCSKVKGTELRRIHGKEMAFTLPLDQVSSFQDLFTYFEERDGGSTHAEALGIRSYGVSMTTLEEVFLKLEEDDNTDIMELGKQPDPTKSPVKRSISHPMSMASGQHDSATNVMVDFVPAPMNEQKTLPKLHKKTENIKIDKLKALCKIRFLRSTREKGLLVVQLIFPAIFVLAGLLVSKLQVTSTDAFNPTAVKIEYPLYISNATGQIDFAGKPLLAKDSAGTTASGSYVATLETFLPVDNYSDVSKLLTIGRHYLGLDIQNITTAGGKIGSELTCLYNDSAIHGIPAIINLVTTSLMQFETKNNSDVLFLWSWPFPASSEQARYDSTAFSSVILLCMAFVIIGPGFAVEVVRDRETKIRSQLRVSGCHHLCTGEVDSLMSAGAVLSALLVFITYVPANLLFAYVISFLFQKFETAQAVLLMLFIMIGLLPYMAVSLVDMIVVGGPATALHYVFTAIDPPYVVFGGIYYIDKIYRVANFQGREVTVKEYFDPANNIVISFLMPLVHCLLCLLFLRMLDIKTTGGDVREAIPCCQKKSTDSRIVPELNSDICDDEDEDVTAERVRVHDLQLKNKSEWPVAVVENLRKQFTRSQKTSCDCKKKKPQEKIKVAVKNASFVVEPGEVLGLLGPNGAGKTTILNMMIAEIGPTKGKVVLGSHDIRSSLSEAFLALGYCPQHDALWKGITLREHLECYSALRGVDRRDVATVVDYFIENLKVSEYAKKKSDKLSGGTKRKLSYAMSMLGDPKVVLLDEPSTGMDPQSKRFLWDTISTSFSGNERGAILTTHYMEEADILCSRVAIMVNGEIQCLGETQHLKNKYGSGYMLEVKLDVKEGNVEERMDHLDKYVLELFPGAICTERFSERAQYKVPRDNVHFLGKTFCALEIGKQSHGMEEYSFSQSTLEQVFLEFAKRQLNDNDDNDDKKSPARLNSVVTHASPQHSPNDINSTVPGNSHASKIDYSITSSHL
ncbi:hypothetical protein ScPMuIL_004334 [Solemya velum]